jgi:SNF2 family DNA or RNA helicase
MYFILTKNFVCVHRDKIVQDSLTCTNREQVECPQDTFRELFDQFKRNLLRAAKKSFSNSRSKPESVVAALIDNKKRQRFIRSLEPSSSTLIVIPNVLLEHWQTQIEMHVDFRYMIKTNKIPLVFEFEKKDHPRSMSVSAATDLCLVKQTHVPVVFLDKSGTRPLPNPQFLAMFRIVVTTTQRFSSEWRKGSFQEELECQERASNSIYSLYQESETSPLLSIHWLRMIVDEGHSMGSSSTKSSICFASWILAQRRWAMTGTPTKQTEVQISQLFNLLKFLQHALIDMRNDDSNWWKSHIARSWRSGNLVSFFRLRSLLTLLMKRHTKNDIFELEPPRFKTTKIPMSSIEAKTYNTLVTGVQLNILATSMKGKTSGLQDSLLHSSQSKSARLALANVRRVCVGWAHVIPTLSEKFYRLTIESAKKLKLSDSTITNIRQFLWRAENEELSACNYCGFCLSVLALMPCCGAMGKYAIH